MANKIDNTQSLFDSSDVWQHIKYAAVMLLAFISSINPATITPWVALFATVFYLLNQASSFISKMRRNSKKDE